MCSLYSVIDDTTKEIVYRDYVDISVAVATPKVQHMDKVQFIGAQFKLSINC